MIDRNDTQWYRDAIIYQLHVKSFFDANDDGVGDFEGLTRKLDYIKDLGVSAIWVMPFYPSPLKDDGYDIAEYRGINPSYGTMRDFRRFVRAAHDRGLRVITELVINHTSDQQSRARPRAISTSGRTPTSAIRRRGSSSLIRRRRTGPGTRSVRPISGTGSIHINPISISTIPACSKPCST
jgi:hypothetical protein